MKDGDRCLLAGTDVVPPNLLEQDGVSLADVSAGAQDTSGAEVEDGMIAEGDNLTAPETDEQDTLTAPDAADPGPTPTDAQADDDSAEPPPDEGGPGGSDSSTVADGTGGTSDPDATAGSQAE